MRKYTSNIEVLEIIHATYKRGLLLKNVSKVINNIDFYQTIVEQVRILKT